ncbi:MAG: ABC transporter ATP-binding protein [Armatimonadetes bacterium]|nr:ABC transporter ATP-binding protein [Armatimonadota bacterium]MDI9583523.1 ABC transporter ATP-binding protein [Acidobacteriota bacterium]
MALLEIEDLTIDFRSLDGTVRALYGVNLSVEPGEVRGLVGESGCGKSQTCLAIPRLVHPSGTVRAKSIRFDGDELTSWSERRMRSLRGNKISMIFQEPMTSLNPCLTVGEQLSEPLVLHRNSTWGEARERAVEMLSRVGISDAAQRYHEYPHQLSGGMRQRAMIAMALICEPRLLLADEPTTALDVTVQAQILELMKRLRDETGAAILLVTHNLGVVAQICDRVSVMYAGRIAEEGTAREIFAQPDHPYTRGLMHSVPRLRPPEGTPEKLEPIPGSVPNISAMPSGCPFHPRCKYAEDICASLLPDFVETGPGHRALCHFAGQLDEKEARV